MRKGIVCIALALASCGVFAQGAKNLRFNEILVTNTSNILDEYGCRNAWFEFHNDAFASANIRNCYLTNNKQVLNKELSAPERIAMMYQIPSTDVATKIPGKQKLLFFADNRPNRGVFHTDFTLQQGQSNWIALYDANGTTLLDSVTVPVMGENQSYARANDGVGEWAVVDAEDVTPKASNCTAVTQSKPAKFKALDQHGFGMTIMAMVVVFSVLLVLYLIFRLVVGKIFICADKRKECKAAAPKAQPASRPAAHQAATDNEVIAAITMALHEFQGNVHDEESGILTIDEAESGWHLVTHSHANSAKK